MTERALLIRADRVFDGTGRRPVEGGFVRVSGGRVTGVGAREDALPVDGPVERFEFPGCTVLSGLIDSHVRLCFSAGAAPLRELQGDTDAAPVKTFPTAGSNEGLSPEPPPSQIWGRSPLRA